MPVCRRRRSAAAGPAKRRGRPCCTDGACKRGDANFAWYQKPSFADFRARVDEARNSGFVVDRGTMFQGITLLSAPVLSPSWQLLLILTAAGHAHDLDGEALGPLSRAMQLAAARLSESVRLLRLG